VSSRREVRALVFDFDGLLVDTEGPALQAWRELYSDYGHDLSPQTWAGAVGRIGGFDPVADLERLTGRSLDGAALRTQRHRRKQDLARHEGLRAGVEDYLAEARRRDLRLGIASSDEFEWVAGHLGRLGIADCFDALRCADGDERISKPSPHLYEVVLADLGVGAQHAVAFEDSPNGIAAATAAGLFCVGVPNPVTEELDLSRADLVLSSLAAVPLSDLIDRIEARQE
jgi:HAD superfamily hydrolase (TIGR01509 family)